MNDKLKRAISSAKKAHEHNDGPADATAVAIGALICAVEILADRLQDEPAEQPNPAPNLIERLKKAYVFAEMDDRAEEALKRVAELEKQLANARADIEAHVTQARCAAVNLGYPDKTLEDAVRAVGLDKVIVDIDGKDSRLLKILEREQREGLSLITESNLAMPGRTLVEAVKDLIELHGSAKKQVEELEKEVTRQQGVIRLQNKTMEDHVSRGVHESMVADLRAKIVEHEAHTRTFDELKAELQRSQTRERELEKRIAELTEPMTVDGKTPGQVANEGYERAAGSRTESWEACAQAVLRAFGNPPSGQTQQANAAEALRRVRDELCNQPAFNLVFGMEYVTITQLRKVFDDELAKLDTVNRCSATDSWATGERFTCRLARGHEGPCDFGATNEDYQRAKLSAKPPSDPATPKLFVAENDLRGSYFCTAITLRPWLHVGHDVEFDDIPRLLKLRRNDIIEVRVVERAKP